MVFRVYDILRKKEKQHMIWVATVISFDEALRKMDDIPVQGLIKCRDALVKVIDDYYIVWSSLIKTHGSCIQHGARSHTVTVHGDCTHNGHGDCTR